MTSDIVINYSNAKYEENNLIQNHFYDKKEISRELGVGASGGIRPNKRRNIVVLFFDSHSLRKVTDYGRNIYQDYFNEKTGLYHYTGQGQKGDQSLSTVGNKWLHNSKSDDNIKVFLFRQYDSFGKHEFIGQVKVIDYYVQSQVDADGKKRNVIIFILKPVNLSPEIINNNIYREIDLELETLDYSKRPSKEKLEEDISKLNEQISRKGATNKIKLRDRTKGEYIRFKGIVFKLKLLYDSECQVCGIKHFSKNIGVYSEVHHLTPWSINHDDTRENLVVICANCHRKFHYAKKGEKESMYNILLSRFPRIKYRKPEMPYFSY